MKWLFICKGLPETAENDLNTVLKMSVSKPMNI